MPKATKSSKHSGEVAEAVEIGQMEVVQEHTDSHTEEEVQVMEQRDTALELGGDSELEVEGATVEIGAEGTDSKAKVVKEKVVKDLTVATPIGTKVIAHLQTTDGSQISVTDVAEAIGEDFFRVIGSMSELVKMGLVDKQRVNKVLCVALTDDGIAYDATQTPRKPNQKHTNKAKREGATKSTKPTIYMMNGNALEVVRQEKKVFLAVNGQVMGTYAISKFKVFRTERDGVELTIRDSEHKGVFEKLLNSPLFVFTIYNPEDFVGYDIVDIQ